ncbi:MAG: hypothetical protein JJU02_00830, partial [Cryomorphaceae bacterium]|nr:hypothetical protein [Cryomorphaceae bacterium]
RATSGNCDQTCDLPISPIPEKQHQPSALSPQPPQITSTIHPAPNPHSRNQPLNAFPSSILFFLFKPNKYLCYRNCGYGNCGYDN